MPSYLVSATRQDRSLLVDTQSEIVDVFVHTSTNPTPGLNVVVVEGQRDIGDTDLQHARYSFTGQMITTSRLRADQQQFGGWGMQWPCISRPFATGYDGIYAIGNGLIWSASSEWKDDSLADTKESYTVTFNSRTCELRQEFGTGTEDLETKRLNNHLMHMTRWKDVRFSTQGRDLDVPLITQTQTDEQPYVWWNRQFAFSDVLTMITQLSNP